MHTTIRTGVALLPLLAAGAMTFAGDETCEVSIDETFARGASGDLYERAVLVQLSGNPRLKLVSDFQPGTWGTWRSDTVEETVTAFTASFRFSLKNQGGGPGDGFSFLWGDMSDDFGTRMAGGEWGLEAFVADGGGLSVGFVTYPGGGGNGVNGRWGGTDFAFSPFTYDLVRWDDDQVAGDPNNMATATVSWTRQAGTTVTIALPTFPPQTIWSDAGQAQTASVDPTGWSFGLAARNGGIDQDVLIGDLSIEVVVECPPDTDPADLNGDGSINGADLGLLLSAWGTCTENPCLGDLTGDGVVDGADLGLVLSGWGSGTP
ncbi:MAG: hypothetical protein CMJ34_04485 [Phycisphaerae bacterium]|nr:hypothetical protein [Phycisphaerae bacterium]